MLNMKYTIIASWDVIDFLSNMTFKLYSFWKTTYIKILNVGTLDYTTINIVLLFQCLVSIRLPFIPCQQGYYLNE